MALFYCTCTWEPTGPQGQKGQVCIQTAREIPLASGGPDRPMGTATPAEKIKIP